MNNVNKVQKNFVYDSNKLDNKYYFLLAISLFFYGQNSLIDLALIILITIIFIVNIKNDNFILSYFALIFFEPILNLPFVGGSFFRIYQVIFFVRLILEAINNKKYNLRYYKVNILAAIFFSLSAFLYVESMDSVVSSIINMLILIYIVIYRDDSEKAEYYSQILAVVGLFSTLSGIYGMFFGTGLNYGYTMRMGATIGDPNYSALFYTLGLFSVFGTYSITKIQKSVLTIILCILLISTVSISGIFGTILLAIAFLGIRKMSKGITAGATAVLGFAVFIQSTFNYGTFFYGLQYRILSMAGSSDLAAITSNRTTISENYIRYFQKLPLAMQLFGGNNTISGETRDTLVNLFGNVSHNSYVDMLYMVGIFGTITMMFFFIVMIIKQIKKYMQDGNVTFLSIAFLKLTILYYSLSISIFPFRYFYTFFIL